MSYGVFVEFVFALETLESDGRMFEMCYYFDDDFAFS
jgi:hypothetical protein